MVSKGLLYLQLISFLQNYDLLLQYDFKITSPGG